VVAVRELNAERIAIMHGQAEELDQGIRASAASAGVGITVRRIGSLLAVGFGNAAGDPDKARHVGQTSAAFHLAAMNHGVYFSARGLIALNTVLTDVDLATVRERLGQALADVAAEVAART
jgi:glutamate-1-semialdehyde 2,1-aminomutase